MDINKLFADVSDEQISAFAFNIGKIIEEIIKIKLEKERIDNKEIKSKIINFRQTIIHHKASLGNLYDEYFGLETESGSNFPLKRFKD